MTEPKDLVSQVEGVDAETRRRTLVILDVLSGRKNVTEAASELEISRERYYELERAAVTAMCEGLKPKKPGRPPKEREPEEVLDLRREQERLKRQNEKLEAKVEILKERGGGGKKPGPPQGRGGPETSEGPRAGGDRGDGGSESAEHP